MYQHSWMVVFILHYCINSDCVKMSHTAGYQINWSCLSVRGSVASPFSLNIRISTMNLTLPLPNNKKCIALLTDLELPLNSHPALPYAWVEHEKIGGGGYLSTFCICLLVCFLFRMGSVPACLGNPGYPLSASSRSDGPREYTKVSAFRLYLCPWL